MLDGNQLCQPPLGIGVEQQDLAREMVEVSKVAGQYFGATTLGRHCTLGPRKWLTRFFDENRGMAKEWVEVVKKILATWPEVRLAPTWGTPDDDKDYIAGCIKYLELE